MVRWRVSYKFLSSFHVWFRGTGRGFESAPLQKHKRYGQLGALCGQDVFDKKIPVDKTQTWTLDFSPDDREQKNFVDNFFLPSGQASAEGTSLVEKFFGRQNANLDAELFTWRQRIKEPSLTILLGMKKFWHLDNRKKTNVDEKFFGRHLFRSTFYPQTFRSTKDSRLGRKKNPWSAEQLEKRTADELAGRQIRQHLFCGRNPNAHNIVLASGGATVRFESLWFFT